LSLRALEYAPTDGGAVLDLVYIVGAVVLFVLLDLLGKALARL